MCTIDDYPAELRGGYYDGAKLVGTREDGAIAHYYNPSSHGVVEYAFDPEHRRLTAGFDPEHRLRSSRTVREYVERVERTEGEYDALSAWARERLAD